MIDILYVPVVLDRDSAGGVLRGLAGDVTGITAVFLNGP